MTTTEKLLKQKKEFIEYLLSKDFKQEETVYMGYDAGYDLYSTIYEMDEWFEERYYDPYRHQIYEIEVKIYPLGKIEIEICDCHIACCGRKIYTGEGTEEIFIKELEKGMLNDLDYTKNGDVRKQDIDKMIQYYS